VSKKATLGIAGSLKNIYLHNVATVLSTARFERVTVDLIQIFLSIMAGFNSIVAYVLRFNR